VFLPDAKTAECFFGFFMANIRNKNTRRAYYKAVCTFSAWCEAGVRDLSDVKPLHVAAYIEGLAVAKPAGPGLSKPTVKQHLAALRMLFDWLVLGRVIDVNPAHAVREPKHVVKKGRTPVLDRDEARALIAAIGTSSLTGLRDRALSQPVGRVIELINPILRGWVNYFAVGHSSRCFSFVKDWVEKKIRRHLMRARKRQGFGWQRWSRQWLYDELGLYNHYRVRRPESVPKANPA
jgi:hypothetical protein